MEIPLNSSKIGFSLADIPSSATIIAVPKLGRTFYVQTNETKTEITLYIILHDHPDLNAVYRYRIDDAFEQWVDSNITPLYLEEMTNKITNPFYLKMIPVILSELPKYRESKEKERKAVPAPFFNHEPSMFC